jgi:hypothetical protein
MSLAGKADLQTLASAVADLKRAVDGQNSFYSDFESVQKG